MIKVNISILAEVTEEWENRFLDFFHQLRELQWVNELGEILVPDESFYEELFEIARQYDIRIILHS